MASSSSLWAQSGNSANPFRDKAHEHKRQNLVDSFNLSLISIWRMMSGIKKEVNTLHVFQVTTVSNVLLVWLTFLIGQQISAPTREEDEEEVEAEERQQWRNVPEVAEFGGGLPLYLHLVSWAECFSRSVSMVYPPRARLCGTALSPLPACLRRWPLPGHTEPHSPHSTPLTANNSQLCVRVYVCVHATQRQCGWSRSALLFFLTLIFKSRGWKENVF